MDFGLRKKERRNCKMVDKRLLEQRNAAKAKKPSFLKQDAHKLDKLSKNWRRPRGMDSKIRKAFRGRRKKPSLGYSSPRKVRGLNRQGFEEVRVHCIKDLEGFNPESQVVLIAKIGLKKKSEILKYCMEKKYNVANVDNPKEFVEDLEQEIKERRQEKKKEVEKKKKDKEKKLKAAEEKKKEEEKKEAAEDESQQEETKKGQKSDKVKILEKRE